MAELTRRHADGSQEELHEIGGLAEPKLNSNLGDSQIGMGQESLGFRETQESIRSMALFP